jgi:Flp pilus assembly protein TadG
VKLKSTNRENGELALQSRGCHSLRRVDRGERPGACRRRRAGEEGAAIVEFAMSAIVLLCMMIGIMELSLALYSHDYVSEAAREGSRYAMVRGSTSCLNTPSLTNCNATAALIQSYVQGLGFPGIGSTSTTVTTTWLSASATQPTTWTACANTCNAPGNLVKVRVVYSFPLSIPFISSQTLSIGSTSQMVIAQ